ncbi:Putative esterase [bacterium HR23]|nr:Putative esterase [bacterium HR23]
MDTVTDMLLVVRSTDMDADGVVNNARYFEFFEQARLEHLLRLGVVVRPRPPGVPQRDFAITQNFCRYLLPLQHRERVLVQAWTEEVRTRAFRLGYRILKEDGQVAAEGWSVQVWLDREGRPVALPEGVAEALRRSLPEWRASSPS